MLTLEQAKEYLRVTFPDDDALIRRLLLVSEEYLHHAVGTYDPNSKRAEMLQCIIVQAASEELTAQSKELHDLISHFKLLKTT